MGATHSRSSLVEAVDLQSIGAELRIYGEIDDDTMRHINPSIAWHDGKLMIAIRSCNFAVERQGKWYFRDGSAYSRTDVLLGDLDPDTLEVNLYKEKLKLSKDSPTRILVSGLEDVRLYSRKDGLHAIGFESDRLTRSLHNESASLAEYIVKGNELIYLRTLDKPKKETVEKNWCPPDIATAAFDYTYSDTQVIKDGKLVGKPTRTQIHGGSQLLRQPNGTFLSLVHEKKPDPSFGYSRFNAVYDKYTYCTYLARHDKQGIITELSKPFRFGTHENIEFAAGMVEHDGYLIMSLGIRDCKYALARIEKRILVDMLKKTD